MTRARRPLTAWRRLAVPVCAAALLAPRLASAADCAGPALGTVSRPATGSQPAALAVGDFDRNGTLDVAAAGGGAAGKISLLPGTGSGGLGAFTSLNTVANPVDIVAGDIDRDGELDLVVASGSSNQVFLHHGTAGLAVSAGTAFDVGVIPSRILLADVSRDGQLDLVVASQTGALVKVFPGNGSFGFQTTASASIAVSAPTGVVVADLDRDGDLDLAVAEGGASRVSVFLGNGNGTFPATPSSTVTLFASPGALSAGDVDRDGNPDLVVSAAGSVSVLLGQGGAAFLRVDPPVAVGAPVVRLALADLDRDGFLDLVTVDDPYPALTAPRLVAFKGADAAPYFSTSQELPFEGSSQPRGLALGDFDADGRVDLVTSLLALDQVVLVENASGPECALVSLGLAPRSYPAGDAPTAAAAGDLDGDGLADLVVANNPTGAGKVRVLPRAPSGYVDDPAKVYAVSPVPRGVAIADFDVDGKPDVVAALGDLGSGRVQILRNQGGGSLVAGSSQPTGANASAVVTADFNGDGAPDVAATSQGDEGPTSGAVWVFLGDGAGGLGPGSQVLSSLNSPRALVAADFTGDGKADLAVGLSGGTGVRVLENAGGGSFTEIVGAVPAVSVNPWGITAADLNADGKADLVTADHGDDRVSVFSGNGNGTFTLKGRYAVETLPNALPVAVAALRVDNTARPDLVVANAGSNTVSLLLDDGAGGFNAASRHSARSSPQAVVTVDADGDGRLDVALPCSKSDAVVVLLTRPPAFEEAKRLAVGGGARPQAAVAVDFDRDGDLDLVVVSKVAENLSLFAYDSAGGGFPATPTSTLSVTGAAPTSVVAADFDRDGLPDLAVNDSTNGKVIVLRGTGGGAFAAVGAFSAGANADDLAAADVDRDGRVDLLVCNKLYAGTVSFLKNTSAGSISFAAPVASGVGNSPTSIFVADLNRDGYLDFAVANDGSAPPFTPPYNLTVRYGNGTGTFPSPATLNLDAADAGPLSVTGADIDGDGDVDLVTVAFQTDTVTVFENTGTSLSPTPIRIPAPAVPLHVTAADLNRDGNVDLAVAASGLVVLRGKRLLASFDDEGFATGRSPAFVVVADWNRDGRPDAAVVNTDSDDVAILMSTACEARRLEVTLQPGACGAGLGPFDFETVVTALDDGGNPALCASGDVTAAIAPGTGTGGALLSFVESPVLPPSLPLAGGVASFTDPGDPDPSNALRIDVPGRRYRLQFSLGGLPVALSRSFTLGAELAIQGPDAFCSSATYATEASYDEYAWTLDSPTPFAFTPSVLLQSLSSGLHVLGVSARVDGCFDTATRTVNAGSWVSTTLSSSGPVVVCGNCIGGTLGAQENGGGPVASRQWGYRTASGAAEPVTPIPGETGQTYVLKGTDFPGPGNYWVVVTSTTTCPAEPKVSSELMVTVSATVDDGEVQFLAVTARGGATDGTGSNRLQWVNSTGTADEICIRWNAAPSTTSTCVFPLLPDCPDTGTDGPGWHRLLGPSTGATAYWDHAGLDLDIDLCYAVFVHQTSPTPQWSSGRLVKARPFDATGPVKWAYSTGATAVVPPSVGKFGVVALSNDRTVHAVERGGTGPASGLWPFGWTPQALGGVVHTRSPIVPLGASVVTVGSKTVLFVGDDEGWAQAIDTSNGQRLWGAAPDFYGVDPSGSAARITGAPGAILQQYGGPQDLVLVGSTNKTAAVASQFFALNPSDGSTAGTPATNGVFDGGGTLGPVLGSPAIDYSTDRVYFVSRRLSAGLPTVWCLQVTANVAAPFGACTGWLNQAGLGDFDTSPTLRSGRLYVANDLVYSLDAATGGGARTFTPSDGPVKGFVFSDRDGDDLFFATTNKVWSVSDTGAAVMPKNWEWTQAGLNPSLVLFWRERGYLYVGGANGTLWQLSSLGAASPTATPLVLGDGKGRVGAPSLDIGVVPPAVSAADKKFLLVGSEAGVLYGIEVPFP